MLTDKQFFTLLALAAVAGFVVYQKGETLITEKLNPASPENIVYQAVKGDTLDTLADYYFGLFDLMNPWAPDYRRQYARQVWGLANGE